jgi:hypothetical protein
MQLDLVVMDGSGIGSGATKPRQLPAGRYTVFTWSDPVECLSSVSLVGDRGKGLTRKWIGRGGGDPPSRAPIVQEDLPEASYSIKIETLTERCGWMVQLILNSIKHGGRPPEPWPWIPAPSPWIIHSGGAQFFQVERAGLYKIDWTVTPTSCPPYGFDLLSPNGATLRLRDRSTGVERRGGPQFLSQGAWRVSLEANCQWVVVIEPCTGPIGGGVRGFLRSR